MNRIYVRHLDTLIYSDKKIRVFLYYMQLRIKTAKTCGGFTLKDAKQYLSLSDTSTRKAIKALKINGYISNTNPTLFKVNAFQKIIGSNSHEKYFKISNEQLLGFSWRNISEFKALICELKIQQNRNYKEYKSRDYYVLDRHKVRTRIKGEDKSPLHTKISISYASDLLNKSERTISNYRKKQSLAVYSKKEVITIQSEKHYESLKLKGGHGFIFKNIPIFVPICSRFSSITFSGY